MVQALSWIKTSHPNFHCLPGQGLTKLLTFQFLNKYSNSAVPLEVEVSPLRGKTVKIFRME